MPAIKRKYRNYTKEDWINVVIHSIDEIVVYKTDKTKIVFTAEEIQTQNKRQCVLWSDIKLNIGDICQIRGFLSSDIFIIKQFLRIKRAEYE
ncbi:MAG: hypothetical protein LUH11_02305 [Candidatus Gastranaerophilales bacterium]|nr:hypothetical protein [Candidatus Gastranaerophilales bacterium]